LAGFSENQNKGGMGMDNIQIPHWPVSAAYQFPGEPLPETFKFLIGRFQPESIQAIRNKNLNSNSSLAGFSSSRKPLASLL